MIKEDGSKVELSFEIVVFTAAAQDYADFILNYIDKENNYINHRLYRHHCKYDDGVYVKDLTLLGRDLDRTIIIDNIKDNFERQPHNGIEILTWLNDTIDRELIKLGTFLTDMIKQQPTDVRPMIKTYTEEKWRNGPSRRAIRKSTLSAQNHNSTINSKDLNSCELKSQLSPMKKNSKLDRYSGTPQK